MCVLTQAGWGAGGVRAGCGWGSDGGGGVGSLARGRFAGAGGWREPSGEFVGEPVEDDLGALNAVDRGPAS